MMVLLLIAGFAPGAEAPGEPAPAETVSRKPPAPRVYSVPLPLIVENRSRMDIQVIISTNREDLRLQASPLLQKLTPLLRPELLQQLQAATDAQGNLRLPTLEAVGLEAVFDEEKLELRVAVPPQVRPASNIQISGARLPPGAEWALKPDAFSSYVNLLTGLQYVERSAADRTKGFSLSGVT